MRDFRSGAFGEHHQQDGNPTTTAATAHSLQDYLNEATKIYDVYLAEEAPFAINVGAEAWQRTTDNLIAIRERVALVEKQTQGQTQMQAQTQTQSLGARTLSHASSSHSQRSQSAQQHSTTTISSLGLSPTHASVNVQVLGSPSHKRLRPGLSQPTSMRTVQPSPLLQSLPGSVRVASDSDKLQPLTLGPASPQSPGSLSAASLTATSPTAVAASPSASAHDQADTHTVLLHDLRRVFDECQQEVQQVMQNDCMGRFKSSSQYQKLVHSAANWAVSRPAARLRQQLSAIVQAGPRQQTKARLTIAARDDALGGDLNMNSSALPLSMVDDSAASGAIASRSPAFEAHGQQQR